jgi:hypothetical protein
VIAPSAGLIAPQRRYVALTAAVKSFLTRWPFRVVDGAARLRVHEDALHLEVIDDEVVTVAEPIGETDLLEVKWVSALVEGTGSNKYPVRNPEMGDEGSEAAMTTTVGSTPKDKKRSRAQYARRRRRLRTFALALAQDYGGPAYLREEQRQLVEALHPASNTLRRTSTRPPTR